MKRGTAAQMLTYFVLILMVSGAYAYTVNSKNICANEICRVKKPKEEDGIRIKANVPLWQSLSRQLITIGK